MGIPFKWQADQLLGTVPDDSFGAWFSNAPGGFVGIRGGPGSFPLTAFGYDGVGQQGGGILFGSNIQNLGQAHIDANANDDGAFVWTERGANGSDVYVGQFQGGPSRTLVAGGAGDQVDPSVAVGADGGFVVAYNDMAVSGGQLVVKVFDPNGVLLRTLSTTDLTPGVSTIGPQTFRDVSVGADDTGTYWVAWGDGSPQEIRLARIFNNGAGINEDVLISVPGEASSQPNLTVLERFGTPFVTWVAGAGSSTTIKASFNGSTPFVVFPDVTPDAGQQVSSAELIDGRIVVTAVGRNGDIVARLLNADGSPATEVFVVNADDTAFCVRPVVAELDDGRFVITWEEDQVGDENLMFAIFDPREEAAEMSGTAKADDVFGTAFDDLYLMNGGDDRAHGGDGDDRLLGEMGNDQLFGEAGADVLIGGRGQDFLIGGEGADRLDGGADRDTVTYEDASAAISLTVGVGGLTGEAAGDIYVSIEAYVGSSFSDVMTGSAVADDLDGAFGNDQLFGGVGDDFLNGGRGNDLIEGGAGADDMDGGPDSFERNTLSYVGSNAGVTVNLSTGAASGGHAQGDTFGGFANLTGSAFGDSLTGDFGANTLIGGRGADVLFGLREDDTLDGGAGADVMTGGLDDDTYVVDDSGDVVVEAADEGVDRVLSSVTFNASGGSTAGLENITLTGSAAINALGNGLANILTGNAANNVLNGGAGADTMSGGLGSDTYVVDNAGDTVVELNQTGVDLVNSSLTYSLAGTYAENLTLTGSANINATGNTLANVLTGNTGNNVLNGGTGADTMTGGLGSDTYVIDNVGDKVVELNEAGVDLVTSRVSYSLGGTYAENLTLTGSANINATGNTLANVLTGNTGANVLNGGAGADTMTGGLGSDTYVIDNVGDKVVELNEAGVDLVTSRVSYSLGGTYAENLTLTGSANINATGNTLANVLTGNTGANVLNGGAGADTMTGGLASDTYVIDNVGDVVVELNEAGVDLVTSRVSYSLGGTYAENLTLTGSANINATGNTLANVLTGNSGINVLSGGKGADTLTGGAGSDRFVFNSTADSTVSAFDRITDLNDTDIINLSAIDARTNVAGNNAFSLVDAFSGVSGQMTVTHAASGNLTTILMDTNGDGAADMKIVANGNHADFENFVF